VGEIRKGVIFPRGNQERGKRKTFIWKYFPIFNNEPKGKIPGLEVMVGNNLISMETAREIGVYLDFGE